MNPQINEIKQIWLKADNDKHTPTCWKYHHRCAIAQLITIIETPPPPPPPPEPTPPTKPTTPPKKKGRPRKT